MTLLARVATLLAAGLLSVGLLASCDDMAPSGGPSGIGEVDIAVQVVRGTLANHRTSRLLVAEDAVYWRELIETEHDSAAELQFVDGTMLSVGPEARVVLDEFVYGGPAGTNRMVLTVTKGISRFITGRMNKAAYEIRAPGAIIGVRGTDFTLYVDPEQGTTTVFVNHGEVAFKRSDGIGDAVILRPGEASRVVAREPAAITPPSPPPADITRSADRMQGLIREARLTREAARPTEKAEQQQPAPVDRRMAAFQPAPSQRDRIADLTEQLRSADRAAERTAAAGGGASAAAGSVAATGAVAPPAVRPAASAASPASPPAAAAAGPASSAPVVQSAPSARQSCSGATCLSEPPPNRVTSPTRM
jgi:hypothetical protein